MPWLHNLYQSNDSNTPNEALCQNCGCRAGAHHRLLEDTIARSRRFNACPSPSDQETMRRRRQIRRPAAGLESFDPLENN